MDNPSGNSSGGGEPPFQTVRKVLFALFLAVSIGYLGSRFFGGVAQLGGAGIAFHQGRLALAILFFSSMVVSQALAAMLVLKHLGCRVDILGGLRGVLAASMGKYLPGKVGGVLFRMEVFTTHRFPARLVFAAMVVEQVYLVSAGISYGILAVLISRKSSVLFPVVFVIGMMSLFLLRYPNRILRGVAWIISLFRKEFPSAELSSRTAVFLWLLSLCSWMFCAFGTWYCATSVSGYGSVTFLELTGRYALAVLGGFLAFFSPSGIGVREGLFVALAPSGGKAMEVIWSVLLRVVISVSEVATLAVVLGVSALSGQRKKTKE